MTTAPLTHHEIIALVEPFTRRGRHVDLARSDRIGRRIAFRSVEVAAAWPGIGAVVENLYLESPPTGSFRLTRDLVAACGMEGRLVAEGADPSELLSLVEACAPERHFFAGTGFVIA